ncbi:tripartite tricarboxylate transporter substrate binding protein [Cupriavidus necator]|uniref:Tripartite tricarboxylate transporter substrate binding protein n=2 Tax=Cupriavidus necator TaxID=106590 RepID=A0A1U9V136_CUPNE|nr:tripartite tricarboxylate transporter substrate binding protein [Cupriavidus necator]
MLRRLLTAVVIPAVLACALSAQADTFPSRSLRIVLPIGPGSSGDTVARYLAERLGNALGQAVVVENRPGADALVAVQSVLNAPADGYSVLLLTPSMVAGPLMNKAALYDAQRDLRPLTMIYRASAVLVTAANSKYASLADILADARAAPGVVSMANYGNTYRVGGILLGQQANLKFNHVNYKGFSQVSGDVIGGVVDCALVDGSAALPLVQAGKLRALASTARARLADLPSVPTLRESGLPDYDLYVWVGLAVRSQTLDAVSQRLERELIKIMATPDFRAFVARLGSAEVMAFTGPQAANEIARETERYRKAIGNIDMGQH